MKHPVLVLLGLLDAVVAPVAQAVGILRWERMLGAHPPILCDPQVCEGYCRAAAASAPPGTGTQRCRACVVFGHDADAGRCGPRH